MFRFIHAADIHLDSPFKGLQSLPTPIRKRIVGSTFVAFDRMIQIAIDEMVDFVLFAGDIFDHSSRSLKAHLHFIKGVEKLAEKNIFSYIVHGNHDPLDGSLWSADLSEKVHVFSSEDVVCIPFIKEGTEMASIYGISYPTRHVTENLVHRFRKETAVFTIGLLHTNCDGSKEHGNYAPCTKQDLLQSNFDYWALGHIHTRSVLHQHPSIVYPGNTQGRHSREQGERGVFLVDVNDRKELQLKFKPVQDVLWLELKFNCSGLTTINQLYSLIKDEKEALRSSNQNSPCILRLIGEGETPLANQLLQTQEIQTMVNEWNENETNEATFVWIESFSFKGYSTTEKHMLLQSEGIFSELVDIIKEFQKDHQGRKLLFSQELNPLLGHFRAGQFIEKWSEEEELDILQEAEELLLTELMGVKKG
jgi:exonuclease SbcD